MLTWNTRLKTIHFQLPTNTLPFLLFYRTSILSGTCVRQSGQGHYFEAIACCETAINMNSDNENGYYAKACCYSLQNDEQQAINNLTKAIEIAPLRCRLEAKVNPDFDNFRSNVEFQALLDK